MICQICHQAYTSIKDELKKGFSKELVDLLFSYPYIKISILEENDIAKRQTASEYLKKISDLGWLTPIKIGREIYYSNHKLINVLSK